MLCVITFVVLLFFLISVSAMPRVKGLTKFRKSNPSFNRDDSRPVVRPREPIQIDNEEGALPASRKRKASQRSLSIESDRDETLEATVGAQGRRLAIAVYFIDILDAPHESEWDGQDGTVAIIHREKKMKPGSQAIIRKVLADVVKCHEEGLEYTGEAKGTQGGHNKLIELDSVEMQLAADAIEANQGYTQATHQVNEYRRTVVMPAGVPPLIDVGRSAVVSAMQRLKPTITPILDAKQGSFDEHQAWAKARLGFCGQLLIRSEKRSEMEVWVHVERPTPEELSSVPAPIPAYFKLSNIGGPIDYNQVAWWDECHKKPIIGGS